jgi:hypothetical membrane protein
MAFFNSRIAGAILFFGTAQFMVLLIAAEALFPNYSVAKNAISDLGVGQTALLFNSSISLFGLCALAFAYFLFKSGQGRIFPSLVAIAGASTLGVGLFPEDAGVSHVIFSFFTFLFCAFSAIYAGARMKLPPPFSQISVFLGVFSLAALALSISRNYLGLGFGGMERMIVYPIIAWCLAFAGIALSKE